MEVFIGLILNEKLTNQNRYKQIFNEIIHLLKTH